MRLLPQQCRDLVDASRAFAWVYLRDHRDPDSSTNMLSKFPLANGLRFALNGPPEDTSTCEYVACVCPKTSGQADVLVATMRGGVHIFSLNTSLGGECRLYTEHAFTDHWLQ